MWPTDRHHLAASTALLQATHINSLLRYILSLPLLTALVTAQAGEDLPEATPYRPTVANPAALSAPGYLELEAGWQWAQGSAPERRRGLPFLAKYAFDPDWGVLLGGELGVSETTAGRQAAGLGDTTLVLKHRLALDATRAYGVETGVKFPTAASGLGNDAHDYLLTGIYSADLGTVQMDVNLGTVRLGSVAPGEGRWQYGWAASLAGELAASWGWAVEVSGSGRRGTPAASRGRWAPPPGHRAYRERWSALYWICVPELPASGG